MSARTKAFEEARDLGLEGAEAIAYIEKAEEREDKQREERRLEREERQKERDHEDRQRDRELQLALAARNQDPSPSETSTPNATHRKFPQMPTFKEGESMEMYISRFEHLADAYELDDGIKEFEFLSLFDGKALGILRRLESPENKFPNMKSALMQAYGLTTEQARHQLDRAMLEENETAAQFQERLKDYVAQWISKDETPQVHGRSYRLNSAHTV